MGAPVMLEVADNAGLQAAISDVIRRSQEADPLAPVTLVVDTAAAGWALRRQVAQAQAPGTGLANVRAVTLLEWMSDLGERVGLTSPATADPLLSSAVYEALLRRQAGPLSSSAEHPQTALRLAGLADELAWCRIDDGIDALAPAGVPLTAREAIAFAARARPEVAAACGSTPWPDLAAAVCAAVGDGSIPSSALGTVIVACARVPAAVQDVLASIADRADVVRLVITCAASPIRARVMDFPDPATETAFAVRLAADAIPASSSPGRVAILYSAETPYARLLERAMDDAAIAWHGPTGQTLRSTTVARCLFAILDLAADLESGAGMPRPSLMRLLGLGHLSGGPAPVSGGTARALIRQEGLYGDSRNWLSHLDAIGDRADGTWDDPENPDDGAPRHADRLARSARPLAIFIRSVEEALARIVTAASWGELGSALWSAHEAYHLQGTWWSIRPDDAATVDALRLLLQEGFASIDALGPQAPGPSARDAQEVIDRALADRRGRHGASSIGIHVGPVSSSRGVVFEHVILLGASEGLLPSVRGDDPLLPDAARLVLRRIPDDLPLSAEREAATARDLRAVVASARSCTALLARGALPGLAVGLPSRYLAGGEPVRISSSRASLTHAPAPVASADLAELSTMTGQLPDPALLPRLASIAAWATPEPGPHFGDLGVGEAVWSAADQDLSASGIEQFLHCPYHFFVQRILGLSTDEFADTVDTIAPSDMGTLLHSAFERFVEQARMEGTLPEPGAAWPDSASAQLRRIVDAEVDAARARGLTGWRPAWERSYDIVMASLPAFLEVDAGEVRGQPATAPVSAEQRFGFDGEPVVAFRVTDEVVVRLRGSIDRVDRSADGSAIGVVDYKSGRSAGFAEKLGKPRRDGTPRPRERVQDLVYDAAARILYPDAQRIDVHFLFVPNGGDRPAVVTPHHDADRPAALRALLQGMDDAGRAGRFLPSPRGTRDYCPVCRRLGRRATIVSGKASEDGEETA
ncbi:MAG: PD-(D/E)XK nuclease family protein [Actinomycetales bacterium]|nr:PD-(D/E)XK nuclease family protein [Actinomycetales bacterium]